MTVVREEITDYVEPPDPFYLRHTAEKKMAALANLEPLHGIRHREFVKEGFVPETLSELIDRLEIDLVVLGTHGREGMRKFVEGSVAEQIVNTLSCPVWTVGPQAPRLSEPHSRLNEILCVTDLPPNPEKAVAYALWLAEQEQAHLTLLHVIKIPAGVHGGDLRSEAAAARRRLLRLLPPGMIARAKVECLVEAGGAAEEILKVSERCAADLIVMNPRQASFARVSAHLPWAMPHKVICHARCPVLTVKE